MWRYEIRCMNSPEDLKGSAIVRRCDTCGIINAIDLVWSEEHERDLQLSDHVVLRVHESEALELWKGAGRCNHNQLIK